MSIIAENLTYIYMPGTPFERAALRDINLKIDEGEFVGIIGHTGSGKSTLIQHFNGLLKPTEGRVVINGMDTTGKELKELRRLVGIVFQYPNISFLRRPSTRTLLSPAQARSHRGGSQGRDIEGGGSGRAQRGYPEKSPFELSGGQKRRVAIAGVLVMKPSILILDEPTAGLDPRGRDEIFGFITRIHKEMGITVILVSHSMGHCPACGQSDRDE